MSLVYCRKEKAKFIKLIMEEKKKKVKKSKKHIQVGNYIVRVFFEDNFPVTIQVKAVSSVWEMFFHDPTSDIFRLLLMATEDKELHQWLEMYLFVTYTACGLPMDGNFLEDMMRAYEQFLTRNAAYLYSGNPDITKDPLIKYGKINNSLSLLQRILLLRMVLLLNSYFCSSHSLANWGSDGSTS